MNTEGDIFTVTKTYLDESTSYSPDETVTESFSNGSAFTYLYNASGNLTEIKENGVTKIKSFYYCNKITREENYYGVKFTIGVMVNWVK